MHPKNIAMRRAAAQQSIRGAIALLLEQADLEDAHRVALVEKMDKRPSRDLNVNAMFELEGLAAALSAVALPDLAKIEWRMYKTALEEQREHEQGLTDEVLEGQLRLIDPNLPDVLRGAGIPPTALHLRAASDDQLLAVPGVGDQTLERIRETLESMLPVPSEQASVIVESYADFVTLLGEIDKGLAERMGESGFTLTAEAVNAATDEELLAIKGVGPATLGKLRDAVEIYRTVHGPLLTDQPEEQ